VSKTTVLPDPETEPVVTVERAGQVLGLSRGSAYEAVRRGEIPSLRFNRRVVVPTARLLALLGVDDAA
jgi:helix-turn-helix protein